MKIRHLKILYIFLMTILLFLIVFTPYIIKSGVLFFEEELIEGFFILILLMIGVGIDVFYRKEISLQNKHMRDAWMHVGTTNLFSERVRELLVDIDRFPQNKKDLKYFFEEMSHKILGLDQYNSVFFRIVEEDSLKTLSEHYSVRGSEDFENIKIGNKELFKKSADINSEVVSSTIVGLDLKVFCVLPHERILDTQRVFIQKILNYMAMIYTIFNKNKI